MLLVIGIYCGDYCYKVYGQVLNVGIFSLFSAVNWIFKFRLRDYFRLFNSVLTGHFNEDIADTFTLPLWLLSWKM